MNALGALELGQFCAKLCDLLLQLRDFCNLDMTFLVYANEAGTVGGRHGKGFFELEVVSCRRSRVNACVCTRIIVIMGEVLWGLVKYTEVEECDGDTSDEDEEAHG